MWTRRELMTGSVLGTAGSAFEAREPSAQEANSQQIKNIIDELNGIKSELSTLADGSNLPSSVVSKLREQMTLFLRANAKFPDYLDVGSSIFYQVYDWHVKNTHPLVVGRQPDGRYVLQFMFSRLILRPESDPGYIGPPYDNR
jgi:hypothetical protein